MALSKAYLGEFGERGRHLRRESFLRKYPTLDKWIDHLIEESGKRAFRACELNWFLGIDVERDVVKNVPDGYPVSNGYALDAADYAMFVGEGRRLYFFEKGVTGSGENFVLKESYERYSHSDLVKKDCSQDYGRSSFQYPV